MAPHNGLLGGRAVARSGWSLVVWPKYSCRTAVVLKQAAEPLSTADCLRRCNLARGRHWEQQHIAHTLMVSFLVKVFQELGYDTP